MNSFVFISTRIISIIGIYDKEELKIEDITKETMLEGTERKRS